MFAPKLLKNDGQKECFSGNAGCTGRTTQGLNSIDPVYGKGLSLSGCSWDTEPAMHVDLQPSFTSPFFGESFLKERLHS